MLIFIFLFEMKAILLCKLETTSLISLIFNRYMCITPLVSDSIYSKILDMAAIRKSRSVVTGDWNYFELTHSHQIKYVGYGSGIGSII